LLCLSSDKEEEYQLLDLIIKAFYAYEMDINWLERLITQEVNATGDNFLSFIHKKSLELTQVLSTVDPSTLMRGNIFVTKVLGSYLKLVCGGVLFFPFKEIIEETLESPLDFEVDPQKLSENHTLENNMNNLIEVLHRFVQIICETVTVMPK
jgi:hypothetical protein